MLTNRSHQAPVILRVQVSVNGRDWTDYMPAASGHWDNPTTETYMAGLLRVEAERQGYRYIRRLESLGSAGEPSVRWDTTGLVDDWEAAGPPDVTDLPEGAFVPPSWRRRRT